MTGIYAGGKAVLTVSRSRFLAFAHPLGSLDDVREWRRRNKIEYPDARHIPYAYVYDGEYHGDDDGEPSGSAAIPLVNLLKEFTAERTLIVVVRYFGGQLLGTKNLARAFKEAGRQALLATVWGPLVTTTVAVLEGPPEQMGELHRFVQQTNARIVNIAYNNKINATLAFDVFESDYLRLSLGPDWRIVSQVTESVVAKPDAIKE